METIANEPGLASPARAKRSEELFHEQADKIHRWTDRMFGYLLLIEWAAGILAAAWISPKTWIGTQSYIHWHVWASVFIGAAIVSFPALLAWKQPGKVLTRHAIAVGQMLMCGLLIHLTGGRIETHFSIFGALAFLAFYRDWKVLLTATVVVAADHFARGIFWPQSIFGVLTASSWRWVEHAGWVVFEDFFLLLSIFQGLKEMRLVADRQSGLEAINAGIEEIVRERTRQLEQSHQQLVEVSRQAGMAEVATSVLHNVGNVLNSVNVSVSVLSERVKKSKSASLGKVAGMLKEHQSDLGNYLSNDPKGRQVPGYLEQLAVQLGEEHASVTGELDSLRKNVDHIKDVVAMQQGYAKVSGVMETVRITDLVEDALQMNARALARHDVQFFREYDEDLPEVMAQKHKVLQILVNLIRNAKQSCDESGREDKRLTLRITNGGDVARISLIDNGVGIPAENLARIFNHGFTTKTDGHGFGLHSSALAAREMGGSLQVQSDGAGQGATFILELPCSPKKDHKAIASNDLKTPELMTSSSR